MRRQLFIACTACCLVAAACGSTSPGLTASRSDDATAAVISLPDPGGTTPPPSSVVPNPNNATINFGDNKTPQPYDDFLQASLADIQDYWRTTFPEVYGKPYTDLTGGIWASYPNRTPAVPEGCPGAPNEEYVAQGNAFYCSNGDYMAYDDYELIPELTKAFGDSAVGVALAHEFGHAIQARVGVLPPTPVVYKEQQADCFAGAWTAHVARGESPYLKFSDADIKAGLSAMVAVKDGVLGVDVFSGRAHGTAFDRVGAFENGFKGGAPACKDMEANPLPLLNLKFSDQTEEQSNGNLPYKEIGPYVVKDLTRFWGGTFTANKLTFNPPTVSSYPHAGPFPKCDGISDSQYPFQALYCTSTNSVVYDEDYAQALYNKFGDFSVGYILSNAWSDGMQTQLGSGLTGEPRALINDCLTGAWTKDIVPPTSGALGDQAYISPGDLDEAVETALITGDQSISSNVMGSAFEKIDNFRAGVLGGIQECNKRITG